ncbi:MAG TPA: hypothetical protein VII09_01060 [Opitutaceae bacterium]
MPPKYDNPPFPGIAGTKPAVPRAKKTVQIVRKLAKGTLLAASIAVSHLGSIPELDPRFPVFDRTLVDRLHAPITRYPE